MIQKLQKRSASSCTSQRPKTSVAIDPIADHRQDGADQAQEQRGLARPLGALPRATLSTPAATEPPTRKNAPVMWSISSHWAVVTGASLL